MKNVIDIPDMISQPCSSKHTQIIYETNKMCVDVVGSWNFEIQEHVETVLHDSKRTSLVDVMEDGEGSSLAPLQQHVDD